MCFIYTLQRGALSTHIPTLACHGIPDPINLVFPLHQLHNAQCRSSKYADLPSNGAIWFVPHEVRRKTLNMRLCCYANVRSQAAGNEATDSHWPALAAELGDTTACFKLVCTAFQQCSKPAQAPKASEALSLHGALAHVQLLELQHIY